jgi:hypothetical protein
MSKNKDRQGPIGTQKQIRKGYSSVWPIVFGEDFFSAIFPGQFLFTLMIYKLYFEQQALYP